MEVDSFKVVNSFAKRSRWEKTLVDEKESCLTQGEVME